MLITGCVLIKNEEDKLRRCLKSFNGLADEIIVVDNGSTDNSCAIAHSFGCKVIHSPNSILDEGRNLYLKAASSPWIFVIDADECLAEAGISMIREAAKNAPDNLMGFHLPRFEYFGKGKWSKTNLLRLFRNHPEVHYDHSPIHASPTPSIIKLNGKFRDLPVPIHHFDILLKNRAEVKRKRYKQLLLKEMKKDLKIQHRIYLTCYLGLEYLAIDELQKSEACYKNAIKLNTSTFGLPHICLAQNYLAQGNLSKAQKEATRTIEINDGFTDEALILMAEIAYRQNHLSDALAYCQRAIDLSPFSPHLYINMAALLKASEPKRACELINHAIHLNPFLLDETIYQEGEQPNFFHRHSYFLSCANFTCADIKKAKISNSID